MVSNNSGGDRNGSLDRLTSLTIQNFRGVRDSLTLDFDASAVLLWGPNGTGKTTVFDALLWLLQGSVPRLAAHTMRRTDEYARNLYQPESMSRITAAIRIADSTVTVTRQGDSQASTLEISYPGNVWPGEPPEGALRRALVRGNLPLEEVLTTSGLLQQDDLRLLLRDKPDQRYRQLLRLLGLEILELFERQLHAQLLDARRRERESRDQLTVSTERQKELDEQIDTVRILVDRSRVNPVDLTVVNKEVGLMQTVELTQESLSVPQLYSVEVETQRLLGRVRGLLTDFDRMSGIEVVDDFQALEQVQDRLVASEQEVEATEQKASDANVLLEAAQQSGDTLDALAALAVPLLQDALPTVDGLVACPICQTPVPPAQTVAGLKTRAIEGFRVAELSAEVSAAQRDAREARMQLIKVESEVRRLNEVRARHKLALSEAVAFAGQLRSISTGMSVKLTGAPGPVEKESDGDLLRWFVGNRESIRSWLSTASYELERVAAIAAQVLSGPRAAQDAAERAAQLPRLDAQLQTARSVLANAAEAARKAQQRTSLLNDLSERTTTAVEDMFRRRFASLAPLMNDIYGRLDPHPAFTKLDFSIETYRSKGTATATVTDESTGVRANPLLVFSSAQANIVALSAFLALGWAAADAGLPFVMMDDPLQSLDDVNVLGFADVMRQVRRQRQVILSTHEERFARVLERKLASRTHRDPLVVHRFLSWSRVGPRVSTRYVSDDQPTELGA